MQQSQLAGGHAEHLLEHTWRPERPAQARDAAADFLLDLPPPLATDLVLLVFELVANTVRHAGGASAVSLRADCRSI
ncbi:hypothetical protein ACFY7H_24650 [Streptomyces sp. NPDC012794]|uniref:hypothetical protein n=1 Tax=Streptomyces sp. NPDC012794 TaxID=3364850 RepID=UPI0036AF035E